MAEPHLRAILETQPVILVRLAKDGTFLAVNESGLAALGAERLDQLLGTPLNALLPTEERGNLQVFIERVISGHRGSIEVDLTGLTGTRHTVQIHAGPHPGAPDGIESVLASIRDVTESRHLEQSLVEAMSRQTDLESTHDAERARLVAELEEARAAGASTAASSAELDALEARLAEAERARTELTYRHAAEIEGLTEALEERTRISEEQAARLTGLAETERRYADQLAAVSGQHQAAESEIENLRAEIDRTRAAIADAVGDRERLQGETDALRASLEQAKEEGERARHEVASRLEADIAALKDALNEAMGEQGRLAETVASREEAANAAYARVSELELNLNELQQSTQSTVAELEGRLAAARQDAESIAQARDAAQARFAARVTALEAALAAAQAADRRAAVRLTAAAKAAGQAARQVLDLAALTSEGSGVSAGELASRVERPLREVLGSSLELAVLVAAPESVLAAPPQIVEQLLVSIALNRSAAVSAGQVTVEVADVGVDEDAARGRAMTPGEVRARGRARERRGRGRRPGGRAVRIGGYEGLGTRRRRPGGCARCRAQHRRVHVARARGTAGRRVRGVRAA